MKKALILILLILIPLNINASQKIILKPDTKGHQGIIRDILITKDKKFIVSASDDKTIRVWDIESGREVKKFLGEIGAGINGQIYGIALSPDNSLLAVGGYLGETKKTGLIRIYDFNSGRLVNVFKAHSNVVYDLNFDESGKFLVSGSLDKQVKVWKRENNSFQLHKTFNQHKEYVLSVNFITRNNKKFIISAGYDNKIFLCSLEDNEIKSYSHSNKLMYTAVSHKYIATCGFGNSILIFNKRLQLVKKIKSETYPTGLSFSANGDYLLSGTGSSPRNCNIYDSKSSFNKIRSFDKHTNLTMAVNFIDNSTAVTGGGGKNEIYIWNILTGNIKNKIAGKGQAVWSVGIDNNKISFGNKYTSSIGKSDFQKIINLDTLSISSPSSFKNFKRINTEFESFTLSHKKGGPYNYYNAILLIKKNGSIVSEIIKDSQNGYGHNTYGFTHKGIIISGGSNGHLKAYSKDGKEIGDFIGHTSEVRSLAMEKNILVSGSDDQIIRLWNLDDLDESSNESKKIHPYLNIFVSHDNEWVAWSNSGYYDSSINGDDFIGFHVNNGPEKEADYFPSKRFFKTYFKPGIIKNIIKLKDEDKGIAYSKKRLKIETAETKNILPPKIILNSPKDIKTKSDTILIDFYVDKNSHNEITNISILLNGSKIKDRGLKRVHNKNLLRIKKEVKLSEKDNIIKIFAENRYSKSNPEYINVKLLKNETDDIYKPNLYLLSIGVSKYLDPSLNLDFAAHDAKTFAGIFNNQKGKIYRSVNTKLITDNEATRMNILKGLHWLKKEATQKDVVMLFMAGHGINNDFNSYFFLPHDADKEFLDGTGVEWTKFNSLVQSLPSKVILFSDSCHSGNITGGKRRGADITGALKELISAGTGQIIMTATTGNSFAYENRAWGHGAFTKAIKDGLYSGFADYNNDNLISVKELDFYITDRVKKLTNGKQKPTTIVPISVPDFPLIVR